LTGRAYLFAGALGLFTLGVQTVLVREALAAFSGTEILLALFYAGWLASFGIGSWVVRTRGGFPALFALAAVLMVLPAWCVAALRLTPAALHLSPGEVPPWWASLACPILASPLGISAGMLFPLGARFIVDPSRLGRFYAAEAGGGLVAGCAVLPWLLTRADAFQTLVPLTGILALATIGLARAIRFRWALGIRLVILAALAHSLAWSHRGHALELTRWRSSGGQGDLMWSGDSRYGHLAAARCGERWSFYVDGKLTFSSPPDPLELLEARTLLMIPPEIRTVGVIAHPVPPIGTVVPDTVKLHVVNEDGLLSAVAARCCGQQTSETAEPRRWLDTLTSPLDLLVVHAAEPLTAVANRFYTQEFFSAAAASLGPRGVLALAAHLPGALATGQQAAVAGGTYHDLKTVFPSVLVSPGPGGWFFAGKDAAFSLGRVRERAARHADGGIAAAHVDLLFPPHETEDLGRALSAATPLPSNTDRHPRGYLRQLHVWLERMGVRGEGIHSMREAMPVAGFLILVLGAWMALRGRAPAARAAATISTTGFVSFAGSMLLLLGFQHAVGTLYQQIAVLNGAYMAGLAAGAWAGARRPAPLWIWDGVLAGILGICAAIVPTIRHPAFYVAANALVAAVAGAQFAAAAWVVGVDGRSQRAAGTLEGADRLGACIGGAAAGIVILPMFGFGGGFLLLALVKVIAVVAMGPPAAGGMGRRISARRSGPTDLAEPRAPAPA
jgi:predicted membrane-bound spermidine synthase